MASLPPRERRILALYYFGEATMKQIGQQIGVNESRVSQLHARAIQRLRRLLTAPVAQSQGPRLVVRAVKVKSRRPAVAKLRGRAPRVPVERRAVA
jgi:RNA polymerase sigma factor for flagellar operon FliA